MGTTTPPPTATASTASVLHWTRAQCVDWAGRKHLNTIVAECIRTEDFDGRCLLALTETDIRDLRDKYGYALKIADIKRFWMAVRGLQSENLASLVDLGLEAGGGGGGGGAPGTMAVGSLAAASAAAIVGSAAGFSNHHSASGSSSFQHSMLCDALQHQHLYGGGGGGGGMGIGGGGGHQHHHHHHHHSSQDVERISPPLSVDGRATSIQPELFKTFISLGYAFLVTWITAIVMVIVHERVPDMKRYPPLPDIFLDNVPHIPWAFSMCEITGTVLFIIWSSVLLVHKHRFVLLRRFFALGGTVFLLRCVTMLITSLSVPGTHLQCNPNDFKLDDSSLTPMESVLLRINRAYSIWSGLGMSIRGVRSCGDYMFSGHTVALTTLNFFITEYTPRHLYFLHTMTWLLNMFGIFFILAAHEHYSIDVFVAFYITSRLFLYYHTLANNQALMSHDSNRTRIWFPMFSYFESSVDGIIPNEYDSLDDVFARICGWIIAAKDCVMLTTRRFWIDAHNQLPPMPTTSQISLFGRNLNEFVLSGSPAKVAAASAAAADERDEDGGGGEVMVAEEILLLETTLAQAAKAKATELRAKSE